MPRRAAKKDSSQDKISAYAEVCGWLVIDNSRAGDGVPDLLLMRRTTGLWVECKSSARSKLTAAQVLWFEKHHRRCVCLVVYDPAEIQDIPRPGSADWTQWERSYFEGHLCDAWRKFVP